MSTWVDGRIYDYYGRQLRCLRRFFIGPLEHVELVDEVLAAAAGGPAESPSFVRTARALAPCVLPRVTETLGGVTAPEFCNHDEHERVRANAGPHLGRLCCEACGSLPRCTWILATTGRCTNPATNGDVCAACEDARDKRRDRAVSSDDTPAE